MAFLNKTMLAAKASDAVTDEHPMLKEQDVPLNIKMVYLQGCVLAAVLNNGALSHAKENEIAKLGKSLRLPEGEVEECIHTVTGLATDDEKEQFVSELFLVLGGDFYPKYFLRDFEEMLKENGVVPADMTDYLNFFGSSLCKNENWRADITSCDEIAKDEKVENDTSSPQTILQPQQSIVEAILQPQQSQKQFKVCRTPVQSDRKYYQDPLFPRIKDIIVEQLGVYVEQVVPHANFIDDLGADSLDAVELIMAFEEEFGAAVPEEDAEKLTTVARVIDYMHSKGY